MCRRIVGRFFNRKTAGKHTLVVNAAASNAHEPEIAERRTGLRQQAENQRRPGGRSQHIADVAPLADSLIALRADLSCKHADARASKLQIDAHQAAPFERP